MLICFIHHISVSIQADQLVVRVGRELDGGIDALFPSHLGKPETECPTAPKNPGLPAMFARAARPVGAQKDGYVQFIDADPLMPLAIACVLPGKTEGDARVEMADGRIIEGSHFLVLS